ncbi:MAG: SurA N-terminal domain-containing protein [Thermodesulfobacteriota bacterium]
MSISFFKEKNSWLTRVILILLAVTFVLGFGYFGVINLENTGISTGTAAEVNGEKIPLVQFYNVRQNMYKQFQAGQGNLPPGADDFINYRALQQLVEAKLLAQKASELGFFISNDELSESIRTNPGFQIDGKFIGLEAYRNAIRQSLNMSVGDFEKGYKEELLVQKIVALINSSAKLTDDELYNLYKVQNENISLYYITFNAEDFTNSASVSENEIQEHYNNNQGDFLTAEKRKIKFAKISKADFANKIQVGDDEVKSYYDSYGDEFKDGDGNQKTLEEATPEIVEKLKSTRVDTAFNDFVLSVRGNSNLEDIDKILVENSFQEAELSDLFSANQDTDKFPAGVINKAFTIESGETSSVAAGDIWLIKLVEIEPKRQKTVEEAKDDVVKTISLNKGGEAAKIAAEETLNKITTSKSSFKDTVNSLGIKINKTDAFPRTNPPENLNVEDLKIDAFLLSKSNPSGTKIYQNGNSYFIISLNEKSNADRSDFEKDKDEIRTQQLQRQQFELVNEWVTKLREESEIVPNPNLFNAYN